MKRRAREKVIKSECGWQVQFRCVRAAYFVAVWVWAEICGGRPFIRRQIS